MNTDTIITQSRTRFDHNQAKQVLREKYEAKMLFAHAGGMWKAGADLLVLLNTVTSDTVVLVDEYGTPVEVATQELKTLVEQRWQEQMNAWLTEHEELRRQR